MLKRVWLSENLFSLVIPINIISLFSKDLITFRIPFKIYFATNSIKVDPTFDIEFDIAVSASGIIVNKDPPNYVTLDNWVFESFALVDKPFTKALKIFETCILVNNNLCGKVISLLGLPTTFDERFEVTSVQTFCSWFRLVSN